MDVVVQYSPPAGLVSPRHTSSTAEPQEILEDEDASGLSIPSADVDSTSATPTIMQSETATNASSDVTTEQGGLTKSKRKHQDIPPSKTFNKAIKISLKEPVGSMSLSPVNRDVVLAARKGLFILDLENPHEEPRFLPHMTTWVPADVQWNPHPARANWVASTSNNKLLVWNLDRPAAYRPSLMMPASIKSGTTLSSSNPLSHLGITPLGGLNGTLPHVPGVFANSEPSGSRSSSISHILNAHTRAITDINWNPFHPEILASCGIDTWMWAWDLRDSSRPKQGYSAWNAAMTQVKWNRASPNRLATSCDNKVLIWDDRKGALPLASIAAATSKIYGIDWSRDTSLGLSRLVTCSLDGDVKWWDLDSPAAQAAIAERRLVTEAETTIKTHTPIWRARHLPFGNGVMTLPQRGDTSLSLWAKDKPDSPVHRFEGHRDIVKEYLIRTQGGSDRDHDDRRFQLITWSKDQTLRLWPITEDMMEAVGHKKGTPIKVLQTRRGAKDMTYRVPPTDPPPAAGLGLNLSSSPEVLVKPLIVTSAYRIDEGGSDREEDYEGSEEEEEPNAASTLDQGTRDGMHPVVEKVFDTVIWTMPFAFLLLMMDIMIQQQYGTQPTFLGEVSRLISTIPILTAFIYYTSISPVLQGRLQQVFLCGISTSCGCSFLYIYSRSPMEMVVRRVPPLGTLWMYTLVKMDLSPVLLSLSIVYLYTVQYNLPILS